MTRCKPLSSSASLALRGTAAAVAAAFIFTLFAAPAAAGEAEATRAGAVEALALARARQQSVTTHLERLATGEADARTALSQARMQSAAGRSESDRKAHVARLASLEHALKGARRLSGDALSLAGHADTGRLAASLAGAEAMIAAGAFDGATSKAVEAAEAYAKLLSQLRTMRDQTMAATQRDAKGRSPLHLGAMTADPQGVRRALEAGAPIDARDHAGHTALHLASWFGDKDVALLLLTQGASVGLTAPMSPVEGDPLGVAREAKCPLTNPTALHLAAYAGRGAVVELLLKHGADAKRQLAFEDDESG